MELQIDEKKFDACLDDILVGYFGQLLSKKRVGDAARSCIRILGEIPWYDLSIPRQLDCLDCYMAGWVDSKKPIKENFK